MTLPGDIAAAFAGNDAPARAPDELTGDEVTDPLWYKDTIIYQLHVRAFFDGNDDGIGDFQGLTRKLDYLKDLGVTALWLLPFHPSPLRDDGYDIADYKGINPSYGRMADFKSFIREAHRRDLRVITELVVNHTSDQHPWFQRARLAKPGSAFRDFYVWSDTDRRFLDTPIIFLDTEKSNWAWDSVARAYYWHRFYTHQPDLNFDNPLVFRAVCNVMRFWLDLGIDGLRLDAVPYLIEREGTINEDPRQPLAARRRKCSPLRDVATMMRSFDYAPAAAVRHAGRTPTGRGTADDRTRRILAPARRRRVSRRLSQIDARLPVISGEQKAGP